MSLMLAVAYANVVIWLYLLMMRGGFWRIHCYDQAPLLSPANQPRVTVVIPARNEADTIPHALPTLLDNDYPAPLHIILVDDRSEDDTAAVAISIARQMNASDRLTVIRAAPMPSNWKGKVWAMQCGLEHSMTMTALPDYVLFTDADIAYDRNALTRLVEHAQSKQLVLASHMVRLRCESVAEQYLIPAFVYFFQLLYPFRWVNQCKRAMAAAAGGCMLVQWKALQRAGGMSAIRNELIDDCAFARVMKKQGRIGLSLTQHIHSIRQYPHLRDIRAMVARTAYDQLNYSPFNLIATIIGMAAIYLAPVVLLLCADGLTQRIAALSVSLMALSFIPLLRFYNRPVVQAITLPIVALFYMGFTVNSAVQYTCGRGGLWKGRVQAERQIA